MVITIFSLSLNYKVMTKIFPQAFSLMAPFVILHGDSTPTTSLLDPCFEKICLKMDINYYPVYLSSQW